MWATDSTRRFFHVLFLVAYFLTYTHTMSGRGGAEDLEDDFEVEDVVAEDEDVDAGFDAGSDVRMHIQQHLPSRPILDHATRSHAFNQGTCTLACLRFFCKPRPHSPTYRSSFPSLPSA